MARFVPYIHTQLQLLLHSLITSDPANGTSISSVWLVSVLEPHPLLTWLSCPFLKLVVYYGTEFLKCYHASEFTT